METARAVTSSSTRPPDVAVSPLQPSDSRHPSPELSTLRPVTVPDELRPVARRLFGDRLALAERFAGLLAGAGVTRGLIGPREVDRLWERHLVNCGLLVDAIPPGTHTLADVGSGAGLPGLVIAIAREDLEVTLIETMQRRVRWLEEAAAELGLEVEVVRARAEDLAGTRTFDAVTARAVAALDKLATWTLPLVGSGGHLLAMKGSSAHDEIEAAAATLHRCGGLDPHVVVVGEGEVDLPTTVVTVRRADPAPAEREQAGRPSTRGARRDRTPH